MSYFTESQTTGDPENFLERVVKEKGEQWSDPNVVAKGYLSAQEYIAQLESQTKEMKEDLSKQDYAKALLEEFKKTGQQPPSPQGDPVPPRATEPEQTTQTFSEDDLKKLVNETLSQKETENTISQNLQEADKKLTELFGTNVEAEMTKRSSELGMSKERLMEIAGESPTAFLQLLGQKPSAEPPVRKGTINTSAVDGFNSTSSERNESYYRKLRQENRGLYYSAKIQQQKFEDAKRLGASFYI